MGTLSDDQVWSARTFTLVGYAFTWSISVRAVSNRLERSCRRFTASSGTSVVKSLVTSTTALLSLGLQAATSKLMMIGSTLLSCTARLMGELLSATMS